MDAKTYTLSDTGGCTCEEIIKVCEYGKGHEKFGCSNSVMEWWTAKYSRGDGIGLPYECKGDEVVRG